MGLEYTDVFRNYNPRVSFAYLSSSANPPDLSCCVSTERRMDAWILACARLTLSMHQSQLDH